MTDPALENITCMSIREKIKEQNARSHIHMYCKGTVYKSKRKVPTVGMGTAEEENEASNIDETWATREERGFMKW